jgi:hypothetical protein
MIDSIAFSIPSKFISGIADGSLVRFGGIIKEAGGGQIVAHLQETGVVQNLMGNAFSPLTSISSIGANFQLNNITKMVETLQILNFASLGVGLVGLGINAVGFKVMSDRLVEVKSELMSLSEKVEFRFLELEARHLREHQSRVISLTGEAALTSSLASPQSEWLRISNAFSEEAGFYKGEVEHLLSLRDFRSEAFKPLVELFSFCNIVRIRTLISAEELSTAKKAALATADDYCSMFDPISPLALSKKSLGNNPNFNYEIKLKSSLEKNKRTIDSIRDAQEAISTVPELIDTLVRKDISGAAFLKKLEEEKVEPIVCLET